VKFFHKRRDEGPEDPALGKIKEHPDPTKNEKDCAI
jgi:hypothetical protein